MMLISVLTLLNCRRSSLLRTFRFSTSIIKIHTQNLKQSIFKCCHTRDCVKHICIIYFLGFLIIKMFIITPMVNNYTIWCFCVLFLFSVCSQTLKIKVLQSRHILKASKLWGSFKLDVGTVWYQPGTIL